MDRQVLLRKGCDFFRQGQLNAAAKVCLQALQQCPSLLDEVPFWALLGGSLTQGGQPERGLNLHQHALQLARQDDYLLCLLHLHIALDLQAMDEANLAQISLQRGMVFPRLQSCPILQELLCQIYCEQGSPELALQSLELAIELYRDDAIAVAYCSRRLLQLFAACPQVESERLGRALRIAEAHLDFFPANERQMRIELGRACQSLGRDLDAVGYFKQALQLKEQQVMTSSRPRSLIAIERKLQNITSEIEIHLLREQNAEQYQQVQQLESAGFRDDITGLYNARYLEMRWDDFLLQAQRGGQVALLCIGINHYASISEVLGKEVALESYIKVAHLLQADQLGKGFLVTTGLGAFELVLLDMLPAEIEHTFVQVQMHVAQLEQGYWPEPLGISVGGAFYQAGESREIFHLRANLALFLAQRKEMHEICWDGEP
ncbi:diguanylate cyclase domain-containing protein [Chitinibacter sp. S2-10]|uniref:diguanylate cyclase domain-containing protein n=1 Tax=Chitinibacter sp. S2-10 TaxID=3373597 RepID=UPI0039775CCB